LSIILLIYSIIPVFLIGLYIYNKDKNKEPTNLIVKLLSGGLTSAIITIIISLILGIFFDIFSADFTKLSGLDLILYAFISVALIEEFSKWIMLYIIGYNSREYDETYDILLYGAFIGLGFACIENIAYVVSGGFETAILRAFTAVPMHTLLGVIMGKFLGKSKENPNTNLQNKILSILIPTLIHGTYDYCIMNGSYYIVSILVLIISFIYAITLLVETSKKNIKKTTQNKNNNEYNNYSQPTPTLETFCSNCGTPYELNYCKKCGKKRNFIIRRK